MTRETVFFFFLPFFIASRGGLVKCVLVSIPGEKVEGSLQILNNGSKMHLRLVWAIP